MVLNIHLVSRHLSDPKARRWNLAASHHLPHVLVNLWWNDGQPTACVAVQILPVASQLHPNITWPLSTTCGMSDLAYLCLVSIKIPSWWLVMVKSSGIKFAINFGVRLPCWSWVGLWQSLHGISEYQPAANCITKLLVNLQQNSFQPKFKLQ